MLLQNIYVPFSIDGAFTDVQVRYAIGNKTPPYFHGERFLQMYIKTLKLYDVNTVSSVIRNDNAPCYYYLL